MSPYTNYNRSRTVPRKRKPKSKHRILLTIILVIVALALICCLLVGGYILSLASELPTITIDDLVNSQTSFVYDGDGAQIATLHGGENRISVDLDEMPQYLKDAVVASEDIRFYQHHGVDYRSVMRAAVVDLIDTIKNGRLTFTQGASTLTMQLVSNVIDQTEKKLDVKIKEALLAVQFEKNYDKDQILYYYLNEIYIGPQIYGVQAAAQYYFGKDVGEITLAEAATLIAILRNPGYYNPYESPDRVMEVRNAVLNNMIKYDAETYGVTAKEAMNEPVAVYDDEEDAAQYDYPWFVDYVVSETSSILEGLGMDSDAVYTGGLNIYTTLDTAVQQALETAYADDSYFPESSTGDIVESAMAIMEPTTGEIKGLVGGRQYTTRRGFNRATDLVRSPGSTIKPIVTYGPAIELGYGAGYVIDDSPYSQGTYKPNNDDFTFLGRITMRTAIMRSRNVCAVKMLQTIGVETGWSYGVKMGLPLVEQDKYNLAMTLGGLTYGVSPLEMAGAFATFANEGVYTKPYAVTRIENAKGEVIYSAQPEYAEVFTPATTYILTDMLTSAVTGGTGVNAKISGWQTAGKTGTNSLPSEDPDYKGKNGIKDAWFCGYTTALCGAVWMGYDDKTDDAGNIQYLSRVYGGSYPAKLFKAVMTLALENGGYENKNFSRPDGVVSKTIDTKTGVSPTSLTPSQFISSELFTAGSSLIGDGTQWMNVEICPESGQLAGRYCPNRETVVRLTIAHSTEEEIAAASAKLAKVDDASWYQPFSTCSLHTTYQGYDSEDDHGGGWFDDWWNSGDDDGGHEGGPSSDYVPNTPTSLAAVSGDDGIYVSWTGNNNGVDTVVYVLECYNETTEETLRYKVYATDYYDINVASGMTYTYRVYAYDEASWQTSSWSKKATVRF